MVLDGFYRVYYDTQNIGSVLCLKVGVSKEQNRVAAQGIHSPISSAFCLLEDKPSKTLKGLCAQQAFTQIVNFRGQNQSFALCLCMYACMCVHIIQHWRILDYALYIIKIQIVNNNDTCSSLWLSVIASALCPFFSKLVKTIAIWQPGS